MISEQGIRGGLMRMKKRAGCIAVFGFMFFSVPGCVSVPDMAGKIGMKKLPKIEWVKMVNRAFASFKIRLSNYTPIQNQYDKSQVNAFYKPHDSYISFLGMKLEIPLYPPRRQDPYTVYLNDLNSGSITIDVKDGRYELRIQNEGAGKEVITNCIKNFNCGILGEPSIDFGPSTFQISLKPVVVNGELDYTDVNVSLDIPSVSVGCDGGCLRSSATNFCGWTGRRCSSFNSR